MKTLKRETAILMISAVAIGVMLVLNLTIFRSYQKNLIALQSDHMLTTAQTAANSLKSYYDETLKHFDLYFKTEITASRLKDYSMEQTEVSGSYLVTADGTVLLSNGVDYSHWLPEIVKAYQEEQREGARLLSPKLMKERHYTQFMVRQIQKGEKPLFIVASIELNTIYEKLIAPIQIGAYGYSMVKDYQGTILMHKSQDQIGIDAVEGRKEKYSEYDLELEDLEQWVIEQRENRDGSRILESYWWEEGKKPVKTKKVVAYTQVPIGDEIWIVNCTLDFNEIKAPLRTAQRYIFLLTVSVVLIFGMLLLLVVGNANRNQTMQREMQHLLEMNEAWEELHKREEQIRHNDKMQTLGAMTSMISHEFNNFLTPMMLYGELLLSDSSIGPDQKGYLKEIVEAAERSKELTTELSRYGRMDREGAKKIMLNIPMEIKGSLALLEKTLPSNIQLEQNLEHTDGYGLMARSGMVNQVVVNLCTNAVHAMKKQGGILTVNGKVIPVGTSLCYGITVRDTGEGIPETLQNQIFTPFYTTKEAGAGTGLGLAVVQDLVYQVSGEISVTSTPGTGTRFDILLPLSQIQAGKREEEKNSGLKALRVYLLDDNESVGKALEKSLKPVCAKVRFCAYPEKALAEIRSQISGWDLVITDYDMPIMDGLAFAGILRSLGYTGKLVLLSGCLDHTPDWYLDRGILDGVLEKPISIQDLEACISS